MAELSVASRDEGEVTVLVVSGSLDVFTAPSLDRVLKEAAARGRFRLVVDLARSPFVGSAGWGVFLTHLKEARKRGGDLGLTGLDAQAQRIYEVFGLQDFLRIYPSLGEAIRAVEAAGPSA